MIIVIGGKIYKMICLDDNFRLAERIHFKSYIGGKIEMFKYRLTRCKMWTKIGINKLLTVYKQFKI